jgi:hypothetical protein
VAREFDHLEVVLSTSDVACPFTPQIQGGGGHHLKFFVILEGGIGVMAKAVDANNAESSRQVDREVAGYRLLRLLGWEKLGAVTVRREIRDPATNVAVDAAVQIMWPDSYGAAPPPITNFAPEDIMRAGIFDILMQHEDRGGSNYLGVPMSGTPTHLVLIDNGNSLRGNPVNSAFSQSVQGQRLTADAIAALDLLVTELAAGHTERLSPYLQQPEIDGIRQRAETMLAGGVV